jgi:hypothetical protein
MVLTRRLGVLGLVHLGLLGLGGCSESLFGAYRGGGGGGSGSDVPGTCTGLCIADASADFDGTPNGAGNHWRYLEDLRNRMWVPMAADVGGMTGSDPDNHITTCAAHPEAPACRALPGALLVSSGGTGSTADSAIEFTATAAQVIQLSLHVFVPSGDDQTIRLYRNSREDVLFTGTATAGTTLDHAITLDALPNDRFLMAVVPTGSNPAIDVGLHLTVTATDTRFPSTCQFSFPFESLTGNTTVDGSCSNGLLTLFGSSGTQATLNLVSGPFVERGKAARIPGGTYLRALASADIIDHAQGVTVQFWVRLAAFVGTNVAWAFSDMDLDYGGGIGIWIAPFGSTSATIHAQTCTDPIGPVIADAFGNYPVDGSWQFVRVVHTSTSIQLCVNGDFVANANLATPALTGMYPPELGKDVFALSSSAYFDGSVDDLRVITGALPCDPTIEAP